LESVFSLASLALSALLACCEPSKVTPRLGLLLFFDVFSFFDPFFFLSCCVPRVSRHVSECRARVRWCLCVCGGA
jgi:hypothetical protein